MSEEQKIEDGLVRLVEACVSHLEELGHVRSSGYQPWFTGGTTVVDVVTVLAGFLANHMAETAYSGTGVVAIDKERRSQQERWSAEHDDTHVDRHLAIAAASLLLPNISWPFESETDPYDRHEERERLAIAGALLAAEIERIDRRSALLEPGFVAFPNTVCSCSEVVAAEGECVHDQNVRALRHYAYGDGVMPEMTALQRAWCMAQLQNRPGLSALTDNRLAFEILELKDGRGGRPTEGE